MRKLLVPLFAVLSLVTFWPAPARAIVGGVDARGNEAYVAYTVSLLSEDAGGIRPSCSAVILDEEFAVTAAHCLTAGVKGYYVGFALNRETMKRDRLRKVVGYRIPPAYNPRRFSRPNNGDLALLRFSGGLPAGYHAPKLVTDPSWLQVGVPVLIAGYGVVDGSTNLGAGTLRAAETFVADGRYSETEVTVDQSQGKASCHGDSGGPAFLNVDGALYLMGVSSRGIGAQECKAREGAYTSLLAYAGWLDVARRELLGR